MVTPVTFSPVKDGPGNGSSATIFGQKGGMNVDSSVFRDLKKRFRKDLTIGGDDKQIGSKTLQALPERLPLLLFPVEKWGLPLSVLGDQFLHR